MRLVVDSQPAGGVELSLVLLDWSCRESFHILDYLADQTVDRNRYEIIWVEYYHPSPLLCRRIEAARAAGSPSPVDVYAAVEMDRALCYHKHLLMNLGIVLGRGSIVCFADSDAMVGPTFVQSIISAFERDDDIVLHMDEVRNDNRGFYPFNYPAFEDVTGFGCINWLNGRPTGLLDKADTLHTPNYGACMAATRRNIVAAGGLDMHIDYLGHIAGAYELTWRLLNSGKREVWCRDEWLYHVWHPGQAGDQNVAGPHDGMHISTRALESRRTGRTQPLVQNPAIAMLRERGPRPGRTDLLEALVERQWLTDWRYDRIGGAERAYRLGRRWIRLKEHGRRGGRDAGFAARPKPLFGHRLRRSQRLGYIPLLAAIVWRQLKVKRRAAAWSRPSAERSAVRRWGRKLRALARFIRRILAFDEYCFRQCWRALCYAAQEHKDRLILYGQGDAAGILCALARHLPVKIEAICPLRRDTPRMFGRPTITAERLAETDATVVVAAFVDTPSHVAKLKELGFSGDDIITLW